MPRAATADFPDVGKPVDPADASAVTDLFAFERAAIRRGLAPVAGVDEVGRGPLAGPVVAAAVILPTLGPDHGLTDSKALTATQRESLCAGLLGRPDVITSVAVVPASVIDRINILNATHRAMREALAGLSVEPALALVDGLAVPDLPVPAEFLVKGDARSASIAAASIVAKVHRDRLMCELAEAYPEYGFEGHKGYGTAEHLAALVAHGPCPRHRRSFAPVRDVLNPPPEQLELPLR